MATVYVAKDLQNAQTVAIKVLREELAALPEFVRRFSREAQKLKRLAHGDIVRIWDFQRKGSLAYIVMEYIEGGTLLKRIADLEGKSMPAEEILNIMTPVCNALTMAHRAGIVHCDIKPANIMIRHGSRAVVTDFGIAREIEGTATMEHFGTSAYMSPEQIQGAEPTPAMDIYALGVILFQLVTGGHRPFDGKSAEITGTTSERIRWEQLNRQPPNLNELNNNITSQMDRFISKCLEKVPTKRHKSVDQVLDGLQKVKIYNRQLSSSRRQVDISKNLSPSRTDNWIIKNQLGLPEIALLAVILSAIIFAGSYLFLNTPDLEIQNDSTNSILPSTRNSTAIKATSQFVQSTWLKMPRLASTITGGKIGCSVRIILKSEKRPFSL